MLHLKIKVTSAESNKGYFYLTFDSVDTWQAADTKDVQSINLRSSSAVLSITDKETSLEVAGKSFMVSQYFIGDAAYFATGEVFRLAKQLDNLITN